MKDKIYDIIIVGAGPAAMGAIQYVDSTLKLKILLISNNPIGHFVYNSIKTHNTIDGLFLFENKKPESLINQYKNLILDKKIEFRLDNINSISHNKKYFILNGKMCYYAKYLLVTTGMSGNKIKDFHNYKNVDFFVTKILTKKLRAKSCVVIGGRNSGCTAANYLSKFCKTVYLLERKNTLPCKEKYYNKVVNCKNIIPITSVNDIFINSKNRSKIKSIAIATNKKTINVSLDYLFIYIGLSPNSQIVSNLCKIDEQKYIITNNHNETSFKNLSAAGDVTGKLSQIMVCHGDGANAIYWLQKKIK